ncbi:MAG TPA: universal stress protein [Actinomycetota bacterium]|nr:universal stress protein [Actinomycetota bacterium]
MIMEHELGNPPRARPPMSVMLATDGSEHALRAARFLARMLDPSIGTVRLHTVLSASMETTSYMGELSDAPERRAAISVAVEQATAASRNILEEAGFATTTSRSFGHPPDEVLTEAEERNIDLLVVGRRGLRMPSALMLGSVSGYLLHHASMPVLIVP